MDNIRARQPKLLLRSDPFRAVPPEDLTSLDLEELASHEVVVNPAKVLNVYKKHCEQDDPDPAVLIRAFTQLGFLFDPNSFFSAADRQILRRHRDFRSLAHDLWYFREELPDASAPVLLYSMANLDYRSAPLTAWLLRVVKKNIGSWRTEVLALLLHSIASLGCGGYSTGEKAVVTFTSPDGDVSEDFAELCGELASELGRRAEVLGGEDGAGEDSGVSLHDWASAAFAMTTANLYDLPSSTEGFGPVLPTLLARACEQIPDYQVLDESGWAQFFLYQTLYCADVEKPANEEGIKRAVPMWIQERLHQRWLNDIVLLAQPQGADQMQKDVDAAMKRTSTQALLNCSFGRPWDEQHCWFAGFLLNPKIALECDSLLPLGPGRPRPSGWLALKGRILRQTGHKVVTLHDCYWHKLDEDQKDDQLRRLCRMAGYVKDKKLAQETKPIRQRPHTYDGIEDKRKEWEPMPSPPE